MRGNRQISKQKEGGCQPLGVLETDSGTKNRFSVYSLKSFIVPSLNGI